MLLSTRIYTLLLLFSILSLIGYSPLFGSTKQLSRYSIQATLNTDSHTLECSQNIIITNTFSKPNSRFYFRLPNRRSSPNTFISDLANDVGYVNGYSPDPVSITSIKSINGNTLTPVYVSESSFVKIQKFSEEALYFYIETPRPILPGRSLSLDMTYTVSIPEVYNNLICYFFRWVS